MAAAADGGVGAGGGACTGVGAGAGAVAAVESRRVSVAESDTGGPVMSKVSQFSVMSRISYTMGHFDSHSDSPQRSVYVKLVGGVMGLLFMGSFVLDLVDILDTREVAAATAFRDEPKDQLTATIVASGAEYTGTCAAPSGECQGGPSPCQALEEQRFPPASAAGGGRAAAAATAAAAAAAARGHGRHAAALREATENPTAAASATRHAAGAAAPARVALAAAVGSAGRQLSEPKHGLRCQERYIPWLLVQWQEGGRNLTRCAYEFGTRAGSERVDAGYEDARQHLAAARPTGSALEVWAQRREDRCVVGFGSLDEEVARIRNHVTWALVLLKLALAVCCASPVLYGLLSRPRFPEPGGPAKNAWRMIRTMDNEEPDADGDGDSEVIHEASRVRWAPSDKSSEAL